MITDIIALQVALSAALFLVLWHFLTPIITQFAALIDERDAKTSRTEAEVSQTRLDLKSLTKQLQEKQQEQRARGVKVREEIIEQMRKEVEAAHDAASHRAATDIEEFRKELVSLKLTLQREIDAESSALSKVILERIGKGSGMNPNALH